MSPNEFLNMPITDVNGNPTTVAGLLVAIQKQVDTVSAPAVAQVDPNVLSAAIAAGVKAALAALSGSIAFKEN